MGWRYRRSVNIGPFRLNFSKSGIGYSVGGKFFRVTKKANGGIRSTSTIPGLHLSKVTEYSAKDVAASTAAAKSTAGNSQRRNGSSKKSIAGGLAILVLVAALVSGGDSATDPQPSTQPEQSTQDETLEDYLSIDRTSIDAAFASIYNAAEISSRVSPDGTVTVGIKTDLPSDAQPQDWSGLCDRLNTALTDASETAAGLGLGMVTAELTADDGTILASGYKGTIKFDLFAQRAAEQAEADRIAAEKAAQASQSASSSSENSRTVYVTPTGSKYHYSSSCNGGSYSATTLDKALARGLKPCGKCT